MKYLLIGIVMQVIQAIVLGAFALHMYGYDVLHIVNVTIIGITFIGFNILSIVLMLKR